MELYTETTRWIQTLSQTNTVQSSQCVLQLSSLNNLSFLVYSVSTKTDIAVLKHHPLVKKKNVCYMNSAENRSTCSAALIL